jgi:hypothetical protein
MCAESSFTVADPRKAGISPVGQHAAAAIVVEVVVVEELAVLVGGRSRD